MDTDLPSSGLINELRHVFLQEDELRGEPSLICNIRNDASHSGGDVPADVPLLVRADVE